MGQQFADSLTSVPDPAKLEALVGPNLTRAMIEGNIGLQYGMQEYYYGLHRRALAQKLAVTTAGQVRQAAQRWLAPEKGAACILRPRQGG
jgi:hypothetical protein